MTDKQRVWLLKKTIEYAEKKGYDEIHLENLKEILK